MQLHEEKTSIGVEQMKQVEGTKVKRIDLVFSWAAVAVLCLVGLAGAEDRRLDSQDAASISAEADQPVVIAQSSNRLTYRNWNAPETDESASEATEKTTVAKPVTEAAAKPSAVAPARPKTMSAKPTAIKASAATKSTTVKKAAPAPVAIKAAPAKKAAPAPVAIKAAPAPAKTVASTPKKPAPVKVAKKTSSTPKAAPKAPAPKQQLAQSKTINTDDFQSDKEVTVEAIAENPDAKPRPVSNRHNIMRVLTGKSLMIDLKSDAKRVSVANPEVAEVMIISPRQVMINGLGDGETTVIIWDNKGNYTMYSLVVGEALAEQVMLEVTVAEINRSAMEKHGVDFRNFGGQFNVLSQYGGVAPTGGDYPPGQDDPPFPVSLDGGISWAIIDTKNDIAAIFQQIQDENLGRILAEPKLLARSGKKANFLSGGEIPIVITTNDDTSIEFKEFGTKIEFIPVVREDGTIDLSLQSEVSEPDFSAGVQLFGFTVPAFVTRRTQTDVTLRNEESLIIAGLIKETRQELESKMPFMGDIPFLGYFFRSTTYENDILELIMVVKPRLVKPVEAGRRIALPTDRGPLTRSEVRTGPVEEDVTRPRPY